MGLYVSDWKARQARCAAKVFGSGPASYPRTREGWTLYWRHARIARKASIGRSMRVAGRILPSPYMPSAPWPVWGWGDTEAQADWRTGEFRYRLMLSAAVALKGSYRDADALVRKADKAFQLGYLTAKGGK